MAASSSTALVSFAESTPAAGAGAGYGASDGLSTDEVSLDFGIGTATMTSEEVRNGMSMSVYLWVVPSPVDVGGCGGSGL